MLSETLPHRILPILLCILVGFSACTNIEFEKQAPTIDQPGEKVIIKTVELSIAGLCVVGLSVAAGLVNPFIAIGILGCGFFAFETDVVYTEPLLCGSINPITNKCTRQVV